MGYIHDVNSYLFVPPEIAKPIDAVATWSFAGFDGANAYYRAAAAGSCTLVIPVLLLGNSVSQRGSYFKSAQVWYKINVAAMTTVTATIKKYNLPADTLSFSSANVDFTHDTGHDGAAERVTAASHTMVLTLDTPVWLDNTSFYAIQLAITAPATATFYYYGSQIFFTRRL